MPDDRKLDVLRAIVEDYVATREPVGSKTLVERHQLGVSPATIRNDMVALEDAGYIVQPHTSAGRIPTDRGYRAFVDQLTTLKPLSVPERRAIQRLFDEAHDLDDIVERTVRLLSQLTRQVAVVQYPSLRRTRLRHVEVVQLGDRVILIVLITDHGRVEQRQVELEAPAPDEVIARLRMLINVAVAGREPTDLERELAALAEQFEPGERDTVLAVASAIGDMVDEVADEKIAVAGTANLTRSNEDFSLSLGPILEALEEQVVLLRLLGDMAQDGQVAVRIGHENEFGPLAETSLVAAGYGAEGKTVARIGVVGPTRMDYPTTISAVRAVARYLSRFLAT